MTVMKNFIPSRVLLAVFLSGISSSPLQAQTIGRTGAVTGIGAPAAIGASLGGAPMTPGLSAAANRLPTFAGPRTPLPELRSALVVDPETSVFSPTGFLTIGDAFDIAASPAMSRLHSAAGFQAMVEGVPAARQALMRDLKEQPDLIKGAKNLAYFSLVRVMEADGPLAERAADVASLSRGYGEFFDGVHADPSMPASVRRQAAKARDKLLDSKQVVNGLAEAHDLQARVARLEASFLALRPAAPSAPPSTPKMDIPSPIPKAKRSKEGEAPIAYRVSMPDLKDAVEDALFALERIRVRGNLAEDPKYTDGLRAKVAAEASRRADKIGSYLSYWKSAAARFSEATIGRSFVVDKTHRIDRVPRHPGLSLIQEPGGFLLKARFKTDFRDPEVSRMVQRSLESYWRGRFAYGGRVYRFRTKVSIEPLRPGESFPPDFLELVDGKGGISRAGSSRITLGKFAYDTPAHEFGHVLGLEDDYKETYVPDARAGDFTLIPGSIMGAADGSVLPRHLKVVYQLLRRNRLQPPR